MDPLTSPDEVDLAALTAVVRRCLASEAAEVVAWRAEALGGGLGASLGGGFLQRIEGTARRGSGTHPWTVVLKLLRSPSEEGPGLRMDQPDPGHQFYWKREANLYASDLLTDLPPGFAAPRCYRIDESAAGIRLWLEDVTEPGGSRWPPARYALASRHLGRFNGVYLAGRPVPEEPWLCRDLLRWRIPLVAGFWERLPAWRADPRVRRGWPGDLLDRGHRVWVERERLFGALARLPRVLCHGDAERRNLFAREAADGTTETVAIDWGLAGARAVGTDLATLVPQSFLYAGAVDPAEISALAEACFADYLVGLREAGWTGENRIARLGYAATSALQYGVLGGNVLAATAGVEERPRLEAGLGMTLEAFLDRHAAIQPIVLSLAEEAIGLLAAR